MKEHEILRKKHGELVIVMRYLAMPENKGLVPQALANKILDETTEIFMRSCEIYDKNMEELKCK